MPPINHHSHAFGRLFFDKKSRLQNQVFICNRVQEKSIQHSSLLLFVKFSCRVMIRVQGSWHESIANHILLEVCLLTTKVAKSGICDGVQDKVSGNIQASSCRQWERHRERQSPFREAKRWSSFAKRIDGATTHLLLEPRLIGPGQRLALPAWGQRLVSAVCQRPSPRNMAAHLLCTHASMGQLGVATRTRISITRWSGSKSKKSFSCCSCSCSSNPWGKHHCCCCCWMATSNSFPVLILVSSIWHAASEPADDAASSSQLPISNPLHCPGPEAEAWSSKPQRWYLLPTNNNFFSLDRTRACIFFCSAISWSQKILRFPLKLHPPQPQEDNLPSHLE